MNRRIPSALAVWIALVAVLALAATWSVPGPLSSPPMDWLALVVLAACAAVAHRFPVPSALQGSSFRLTPALIVAGATILPAGLLTPLALLAVSPDLWFRRHRPRVLVGWTFNVSQTALSAHAAALWIRAFGAQGRLESVLDLSVLLTGGVLFMVIQETLVATVVALDSRTPISRSILFSQTAMISNSLVCLLGVSVAGLWLAKPILLLLIMPVVVLAYRLARTAHLAQLADLDTKTGVYTPAHFEREVEKQLDRHRRLNRAFAVVFGDLDHFKRVNDTWGHAAGDRVLRVVADRLVAECRRGDLVARFGGEEFVVLLPGTDRDEALYIAERLRTAVAEQPVEIGDGIQVRCTISLGVAVYPDHGTDFAALLKTADGAMYEAKATTRNAVKIGPAYTSGEVDRETFATPASAPDITQVGSPQLRDWKTTLAVWTPSLVGMATVLASVVAVATTNSWAALLPLIGLAIVGELISVRVHDVDGQQISFTFSVVVATAAAVALPAGAPIVAVAGAIAHVTRTRQRDPSKLLFNIFAPPLATAGALTAYAAARPYDATPDTPIMAAAAAAVAYYAVNIGTIALVVSLHTGRGFVNVLTQSAWFTPTKIGFGLTGAFLGAASGRLGIAGAAMFVAPLLILRFTLSFYASRSQRAIDKLRVLNAQLTSEVGRRLQSERRLEHLAKFDTLTDLPNRLLLRERLDIAMQSTGAALLLLDLDHFKEINDTFGHDYGDRLLREVGQRLRRGVRDEDVIARLGGDEFAVLLLGANRATAEVRAKALLASLQQPCAIDGYAIHVSGSIGVALAPEHGQDPEVLLRHADVAMYLAKQDRRSVVVYDPARDEYSPDKLALVGQLRQAIHSDLLTLHFQPKLALNGSRLVGVEALVRWIHPSLGHVPPSTFVPLAERTGLIGDLTGWVLEKAIEQCSAWLAVGYSIPVAINMSGHDLQDPDLVARVIAALRRHDLPPEYLRVEVTESTMVSDLETASRLLSELRRYRVSVSIDDFGTGYSSLSYLKQMPVDELKLDRSFVKDLTVDRVDAAIVRSAIQMGHEMGLQVLAEGVEDATTWACLRQLGCDLAQGYYASRPLPADQLLDWLRTTSSDASRAA